MSLPEEILQAIPEDIRGSEHIASYNDVGSLVKDFIGVKTADWRTSLPEDIRAEKSLEAFKGIGDLAKGFVETKKMVGQTLRAPAADAPEEEWEKFYRASGRPNAPEEYKLTYPEGVFSKEEEKELQSIAYRMGLTPRQAQRWVDAHLDGLKVMDREEQAEQEKTEALYRQKWGANFDRNVAIVDRTIDRLDPEHKLRTFLEATGLNSHPVIIDLMLRFGNKMVEDGMMAGDVEGATTREDAVKRIHEIRNDPKHPYHKSKAGDPAFEEFKALHEIAYG